MICQNAQCWGIRETEIAKIASNDNSKSQNIPKLAFQQSKSLILAGFDILNSPK